MAWRDWRLDECVAVDRMTVAEIRGQLEGQPQPCRFWTKESSLELPPGWQHMPAPGIDSGSFAVARALLRPDPVIVIGADGIMGGEHSTEYAYRWHPRGPTESIHLRHRLALQALVQNYPGRVTVCWPDRDNDFVTLHPNEVFELLNKYRKEELRGQTIHCQA